MFLSNLAFIFIYKLLFILAKILKPLIMKHLIYFVSILFFVTIFCKSATAQRGYYEQEYEMPFQPRFILGSSYYNSLGDIQGPDAGSLLGNIGFKSGVSFNLNENVDLSLLFNRFKLAEESATDKFSSEVRSFGLHFDYTLYKLLKNSRLSPLIGIGIHNINFKTINYFNNNNEKVVYADESSFILPANVGVSLNVSERIKLNLSYNYILNFSDIDKYENESSDNISMVDFTICYDFFTKIAREKPIDDSFYSDVNFEKFDVEDTDGDMVPDNDDHCPETPQGVKVDEKGCAIDTDNDGIADYLDKELNTRIGALVDEGGVELTEAKYESIYGFVAASRKYANIYNESEIKKEDYLNINDYLIAKANEFNNNYNQTVESNKLVSGLLYRVEIGRYADDIPEEDEIRMLMLNDLKSTTKGDFVLYMVGKYNSKDEALKREYELDSQGFLDCYILVDNNGKIERYTPPMPPKPKQDDKKNQVFNDSISEKENKEIDINKVVKIDEPVYRVQIGAFKEALPEQVFAGIDNVISMKDKDGFIRYMTGSFTNKKDGVDYMFQMRARGFEDAFLVSYKNGKRSIEFFVPKNSIDLSSKKENKKPEEKAKKKAEIEFIVQILVTDQVLNADQIQGVGKLKNVQKINVGANMFAYYAGSFIKIQDANNRLNEAKNLGFENAFIFASKNGERITIEEALNK